MSKLISKPLLRKSDTRKNKEGWFVLRESCVKCGASYPPIPLDKKTGKSITQQTIRNVRIIDQLIFLHRV
ncbi:MAG: hypothetical protein ACHQ6U_13515 [Thermodesulfobacteriota bacterium]